MTLDIQIVSGGCSKKIWFVHRIFLLSTVWWSNQPNCLVGRKLVLRFRGPRFEFQCALSLFLPSSYNCIFSFSKIFGSEELFSFSGCSEATVFYWVYYFVDFWLYCTCISIGGLRLPAVSLRVLVALSYSGSGPSIPSTPRTLPTPQSPTAYHA